jgi:dTDP-4-dehydrorhamnose reductase
VKILLTGANGQLGFELRRSLAPLGAVTAVDLPECDLADAAAIAALLDRVAPECIVNPAAHTAVDRAESEPAFARAINAEAPRLLGEWAAARGVPVIHYSTDYVFDGGKSGSYTETDATNPQGVYGLSKRDGEIALTRANPRHLILRTSWVVGAHGGNFARTMLRLAAERDELRVVADQWGAPTSAALLADLTAHLLRQWQQQRDAFPFGLYHAAAAGETNWCEYARFVIGKAIAAGRALKAGPNQVRAIATADYPTPARRPANSRLDTTKFRETFDLNLPHWRDGVGQVLDQIL